MTYNFYLDVTFTDYATATRKFKPVTTKQTVKINARNVVEAEILLQAEFFTKAPARVRREYKLAGHCYTSLFGQLTDRYDLVIAFEVNK